MAPEGDLCIVSLLFLSFSCFSLAFFFRKEKKKNARGRKKEGNNNILVSIEQIKDDALFDSTNPEQNAAQLGALPMHLSHEQCGADLNFNIMIKV